MVYDELVIRYSLHFAVCNLQSLSWVAKQSSSFENSSFKFTQIERIDVRPQLDRFMLNHIDASWLWSPCLQSANLKFWLQLTMVKEPFKEEKRSVILIVDYNL